MGILRVGLIAACIATIPLSACTSGSADDGHASRSTGKVVADGSPGVWELDHDQHLDDSSTKFKALVTRLACNSGKTGQVVEPVVKRTKSQVIVTFQVTPTDDRAANCQGNKLVPYEVDLGEPLNGRKLKDGQCLPGQAAETTALCDSSRWTP